MKIISFCSALVVAGTLSTSALAAGYVQNSNIQKKVFEKTLGSSTCGDIETRIYDGAGSETRILSDSGGSTNCKTSSYFADKTATTHTMSSYEYAGTIIEFSPGLRVIIDDMSLNSTWNDDTDVIINGSIDSTRNDSYEVILIENVTVDAGVFTGCAKVEWTIASTHSFDLWFCEDVGLVKYDDKVNAETWELQSYVNNGSLTVVDGSEYIQTSSISNKVFLDTYAAGTGCDKNSRTFSGDNEVRVYSNSEGDEINCFTVNVGTNKTETSQNFFSQAFSTVDVRYSPGVPVLVANMAVGQSWEQRSNTYDSEAAHKGYRNDSFTLQGIESVSVNAGNYSQCLNILWQGYDSYIMGSFAYTLYICPDVGLVKYAKAGENWQLQSMSHSSSANVGGSSGGGSLPLSMLVILGVIGIAVRRK